jgi:hypothetical protein
MIIPLKLRTCRINLLQVKQQWKTEMHRKKHNPGGCCRSTEFQIVAPRRS